MYRKIKEQLKRSLFIHDSYLFLRNRLSWLVWIFRGRTDPQPHIVKQWCVLEYGRKFNLPILVETGTYLGEMVQLMRSAFHEIYTIELGDGLAADAKRLFMPFPHVHVLHGDSAKVLRDVLGQIQEPCLFWLDAHYSGGVTTLADSETPVLGELDCIFSHAVKMHVILIDDARCFDGKGDYPALSKIKELVNERRPDWVCEVHDDIIRIHSK